MYNGYQLEDVKELKGMLLRKFTEGHTEQTAEGKREILYIEVIGATAEAEEMHLLNESELINKKVEVKKESTLPDYIKGVEGEIIETINNYIVKVLINNEVYKLYIEDLKILIEEPSKATITETNQEPSKNKVTQLIGDDAKYNNIIYLDGGKKSVIGFNDWLQIKSGYSSLNEIRETADNQKWGVGEVDQVCKNFCNKFREFAYKYNLDTRY